jgi:acyl-CoA thioester hydrolase
MSFTLTDKIEIKVRFNHSDPLGIVWHGHYIGYFEDGRESFGEKYGLRYLDIYKKGFVAPIVSINCDYKKTLKYGDTAIVETIFVDSPAAKIHFRYKIYMPGTLQTVAEGKSVQVFLDVKTMLLQLSTPEFFEQWKKTQRLKMQ